MTRPFGSPCWTRPAERRNGARFSYAALPPCDGLRRHLGAVERRPGSRSGTADVVVGSRTKGVLPRIHTLHTKIEHHAPLRPQYGRAARQRLAVAGSCDARPALWSPGPRRATGETDPHGTRPEGGVHVSPVTAACGPACDCTSRSSEQRGCSSPPPGFSSPQPLVTPVPSPAASRRAACSTTWSPARRSRAPASRATPRSR